jgi:hypothetical protein
MIHDECHTRKFLQIAGQVFHVAGKEQKRRHAHVVGSHEKAGNAAWFPVSSSVSDERCCSIIG